jgi:site-specific recombinase XerD
MTPPKALTVRPDATVPSLADGYAAADALIAASRSPSTVRAYRADWDRFATWCSQVGVQPLDARPDQIAAYVATLLHEGYKPTTVSRAVASLTAAYTAAGRA